MTQAAALRLWADLWWARRTIVSVSESAAGRRRIELSAPSCLAELTTRQGQVVRAIALGVPNKRVAAALGLSESCVATYLAHALAKMDATLATLRLALPGVLAPAQGDLAKALRAPFPCPEGATAQGRSLTLRLPPVVLPERLTAAEADVLRMAVEGHGIASTAEARGTSARTVANQRAHAYSKLRVGSCRDIDTALLAALRRRAREER